VLIAEDEANIALALQTIVRRLVNDGNVAIVNDGQAALEALQGADYDLLISDWNMPRMTGLELLSAVRANERTFKLPFLMLTARADMDSVRQALGVGVSDYIAKPFDKDKLVAKVNKMLRPDTPQMAQGQAAAQKPLSIREAVAAKLQQQDIIFPVLPEVAFKAVEVINSAEVSVQEVADIIKADAGLTSKMIAMANSAYYRAVTPVQNLQYAIGRIGLRDSGNIILMHTTRGMFNAENPAFENLQRALWAHSLATAVGARVIGRKLEHPFPERLYAAGMLHDIGKALLLQVLMELSQSRHDITEDVVNETLDRLHVEFGVALLKHWQFPAGFIDVVQEHHNYEQMQEYTFDTQIVSYANLLTRRMGMSLHAADDDSEAMSELGKLIGMQHQPMELVIQEILSYVDEIKAVI
jgi:putative nucleotidyltransferase with HDIG domain